MQKNALRAGLLLATALASCTPPRQAADPFSGARPSSREGVRQYRVRLEVGCDNCTVQYWTGPNSRQESANQVWSRNLTFTPLMPMAIRLSATPEVDGRPVRYVRISVDGEVVAEVGCNECEDRTTELTRRDRTTRSIETVIPPR